MKIHPKLAVEVVLEVANSPLVGITSWLVHIPCATFGPPTTLTYLKSDENKYEWVIRNWDVLKSSIAEMKKRAHKTRRQLQAEKEKAAKQLVDRANAQINPLALLECFRNYTAKDGAAIKVSCHRVNNVPEKTVSWVLDLMERNMKQMYEESAWGWDPLAKQKELLEPLAWYLIATCDDEPIAFSHFRFDTDYGVEVLYCYEIQLEPSARRRGLGCFMMQALESMAYQTHMQKVVMTVFKHNPAAISFFHSLGYRLDSTNPYTTEKLHYIILSKQNLCIVNPRAE